MMTVFDTYLIPILIAVAIGLLIGIWMFRAGRDEKPIDEAPRGRIEAAPIEPESATHHEAADTSDVPERDVAAEPAAAMPDVEPQARPAAVDGPPDNLQMLKGVGPRLAVQLNENGITRFDQLARLNQSEIESLDARLGSFRGRLSRDRVTEQAAYLASGDRDGFEARFGRLGSE